MALENRKSIEPLRPDTRPPKKESLVAPEKAAKKLYTDAMFTISKLTERAKRTTREIDELTNTRFGDEQLHAFGTPSAAETAALNSLTEKIQTKLKKAQEELVAASEAYSKLDQDLNDLGIIADTSMRLTISNKRDLTSGLLEKINERIQQESSQHEQDARRQAIREALRPTEPMPLPKPKKERRPFTETLARPEGETITAGEINEFAKLYDEAARKDLEGVITEEDEARRIEEANLSEVAPAYTPEELAARKNKITSSKLTPTTSGERLVNVARTKTPYEGDFIDTESAKDAAEERAKEAQRMAEVTPEYTEAEIAARSKNKTTSKLTPTTSGERLVNVARSTNEYTGDFGPKTAEEFLKQQQANTRETANQPVTNETVSIDFNELGVQLDQLKEDVERGTIKTFEQLNTELNNRGLRSAINELIPSSDHEKNISELAGKKIFGLFGKPKFDQETVRKYFSNLVGKSFARAASEVDARPAGEKKNPELSKWITLPSGERSATVTRAPGKEFVIDAEAEQEENSWNEAVASAKTETGEKSEAANIEKTVDAYIDNATPVFIKRRSGEMNSGGRVRLQTADGRALVTWTDPKTQIEASKYVKSSDLVSWQKEGVKAPSTKNYEKPRTMYEAAEEYLNSIQEQLKSGQISSTAQLEMALTQMKDPSYQDLLSSQERFTTKISEAVSDKIPGFFGAKYKFNQNLAASFVEKLKQNAAKTAETFRE